MNIAEPSGSHHEQDDVVESRTSWRAIQLSAFGPEAGQYATHIATRKPRPTRCEALLARNDMILAEREGFEPPVRLRVQLISSQPII